MYPDPVCVVDGAMEVKEEDFLDSNQHRFWDSNQHVDLKGFNSCTLYILARQSLEMLYKGDWQTEGLGEIFAQSVV